MTVCWAFSASFCLCLLFFSAKAGNVIRVYNDSYNSLRNMRLIPMTAENPSMQHVLTGPVSKF